MRRLLEPLPQSPGMSKPPKPQLFQRPLHAGYGGAACIDLQDDMPAFNPPLRPRTAEGELRFVERPRTADSRGRAALKLGSVLFPSQLRLRPFTEAPGMDTPWASPGEALVLSLELQCKVRESAAANGEAGWEVTDGTQLTVWAAVVQPEDGTCTLEPLVAKRVDQSLAVEPLEVVVELQGASGSESPRTLRFGEGFRLRLAGAALYLSHSNGHIHWERKPADADQQWPHDSRFTAHGGELGASVRFGRHLSLQRISSPPPSDSESDSGSSSESDSERILRGAPPRRNHAARAAARSRGYEASATAKCFPDGFVSRLADKAPVLSSVFLPLVLS